MYGAGGDHNRISGDIERQRIVRVWSQYLFFGLMQSCIMSCVSR